VRFVPLAEDTVRAFLEQRAGVAPGEARLLAALAGGHLARAITLRDGDPVRLRNEALALLDPAQRWDAPGLWKASQAFMKYGRTGRETLRRGGRCQCEQERESKHKVLHRQQLREWRNAQHCRMFRMVTKSKR
jgi:hypothetical protein